MEIHLIARIAILSLTLTFAQILSPSDGFAHTIKVMTYNTWGVPVATWDTWRYREAMRAIEAIGPDVVVLNEVFTQKGKHQFKSNQYPFQLDGPGPVPRLVGSGLRILSKFPIVNRAILTFRACKTTDCLSRKGAALVTLALPKGKKLNLIGTHLDSSGPKETRISQLKQIRLLNEWYSDRSAPTILAGDMNFKSHSAEYEFTREKFEVRDAWMETHQSSDPGHTYDCYSNHYARDYSIKTNEPLITERLDYLFHRGAIRTIKTELKFNDEENLFSDHYALMGEFEI
jgi:endonuclease/exonuclease/phosphatase family metal-dependent hydrolase